MYQVGLNAGLTFQIIDDLLDYTASEVTLGKKLGDDFYEGKVTLPMIFLYNAATKQDRSQIKEIFDNKAPTDFKVLLSMLNQYNIVAKVKDTARSYINKALDILLKIPSDEETKDLFKTLLKKQVDRLS